MPQKSKYNLTSVKSGKEPLGERIARIRKEKGYTQTDLAEKIGISQVLVSNYERNRLRPHFEMIVSFAQALEVTADELLGLKAMKKNESPPTLKIIRRLKKIEKLSPTQQRSLLNTIDTFLKGAEK